MTRRCGDESDPFNGLEADALGAEQQLLQRQQKSLRDELASARERCADLQRSAEEERAEMSSVLLERAVWGF